MVKLPAFEGPRKGLLSMLRRAKNCFTFPGVGARGCGCKDFHVVDMRGRCFDYDQTFGAVVHSW